MDSNLIKALQPWIEATEQLKQPPDQDGELTKAQQDIQEATERFANSTFLGGEVAQRLQDIASAADMAASGIQALIEHGCLPKPRRERTINRRHWIKTR